MNGGKDDLVRYRLDKAFETLEDARVLASAGRWSPCVNRLYYACFYAVSALLISDSMSSAKHTGVRSLFNRFYVKTGKIPKEMAQVFNDLFEKRREGDYMDFVRFDEVSVRPWLPRAEAFVGCTRNFLE